MTTSTRVAEADVEAARRQRDAAARDRALKSLAKARLHVERSCRLRGLLRVQRLKEECDLLAVLGVFYLINVDSFTRDDLMVLCATTLAGMTACPGLLLGPRASEILCDLFEALHVDPLLLHDLSSRDIVPAERHGAWIVADEQYEAFLAAEHKGVVAEPLQRVVKALTIHLLDAGLVLADLRRLAAELASDASQRAAASLRARFFWGVASLVNACFRSVHLPQPALSDDLRRQVAEARAEVPREERRRQRLLIDVLLQLQQVPGAHFDDEELALLRSTGRYTDEAAELLSADDAPSASLDELADLIKAHPELRDELDGSMWEEAYHTLRRTCVLQLSLLPLCRYGLTGHAVQLLELLANPKFEALVASLAWLAQVFLYLCDFGLQPAVLLGVVRRSCSRRGEVLLVHDAASFRTARDAFDVERAALLHVAPTDASSQRSAFVSQHYLPLTPQQSHFIRLFRRLAGVNASAEAPPPRSPGPSTDRRSRTRAPSRASSSGDAHASGGRLASSGSGALRSDGDVESSNSAEAPSLSSRSRGPSMDRRSKPSSPSRASSSGDAHATAGVGPQSSESGSPGALRSSGGDKESSRSSEASRVRPRSAGRRSPSSGSSAVSSYAPRSPSPFEKNSKSSPSATASSRTVRAQRLRDRQPSSPSTRESRSKEAETFVHAVLRAEQSRGIQPPPPRVSEPVLLRDLRRALEMSRALEASLAGTSVGSRARRSASSRSASSRSTSSRSASSRSASSRSTSSRSTSSRSTSSRSTSSRSASRTPASRLPHASSESEVEAPPASASPLTRPWFRFSRSPLIPTTAGEKGPSKEQSVRREGSKGEAAADRAPVPLGPEQHGDGGNGVPSSLQLRSRAL